ncbi:MAG: hypothetical protein JWM12_3598 [Ilumatobacteraceae bacterium]|nr:hypothetical protein [Ilumatobacteraceae bacterium]
MAGVGLILLGIAFRAEQNGDRLQTTGRRTTGTVQAIRLTRDGSGGGVSGYVTVRYADDVGDEHTAELNLGRSAPHHAVGEPIEVVYDPAHPARVQVVGAAPDAAPLPWPALVLLGMVAGAIAIGLAKRLRWTWRVLRANPWVEAGSRVLEVPLAGGSQHALTLVELRGAPDDGPTLAVAATWRARPMVAFTPKAWVAGSDRRFVIAAPGGAPMVRAKRVRLTAATLDDGRRVPPPSRLGPAV